MNYVGNLNNLDKNDSGVIGGKGASLGELLRTDISVPTGFIVFANAFEEFLELSNLKKTIKVMLQLARSKEIEMIETASEKIRSLILKAAIPTKISKEIKLYFKELGAEFVVVRSSTTAEDSLSSTWAGQLNTFLNVSEKNLEESIKKCWASLFTPRAIFYRFEKEPSVKKISVAVIVQKIVNAEVSGVVFTSHPETYDENQIVIEAGWGLGEALLSGQITPDKYIINARNFNYFLDILSNKKISA